MSFPPHTLRAGAGGLPRFVRKDKKNVTPATEPGPRLMDVAPMARGLLYLDPGSVSPTQRVARGPIARDDNREQARDDAFLNSEH